MKFRTLVLVLLGATGLVLAACSGDKTAQAPKPYHKPSVEEYDPTTGEWRVASSIAVPPPHPPETPPMPKQPKPKPANQSFLAKVKSKMPWTKKPQEQSNVVQEPSPTTGAAAAGPNKGVPAANQLPAEPTPAQVPAPPPAQ